MPVTWGPDVSSIRHEFSNGNRDVSIGYGWESRPAVCNTKLPDTGKFYWEIMWVGIDPGRDGQPYSWKMGMVDINNSPREMSSLGDPESGGAFSFGMDEGVLTADPSYRHGDMDYNPDGSSSSSSTITQVGPVYHNNSQGDPVEPPHQQRWMFAVDMTNGLFWMGVDGSWGHSDGVTVGDPAGGTNESFDFKTNMLDGNAGIAPYDWRPAMNGGGDCIIRSYFERWEWVYAPPDGYDSISGVDQYPLGDGLSRARARSLGSVRVLPIHVNARCPAGARSIGAARQSTLHGAGLSHAGGRSVGSVQVVGPDPFVRHVVRYSEYDLFYRHLALYSATVQALHRVPLTYLVEAKHRASFSYLQPVGRKHTATYSESNPVSNVHRAAYNLTLLNPIDRRHVIIFDMLDVSTVVHSFEVYCQLASTRIPVRQAQISIDEGQYLWTAQIQLTNVDDFVQFSRDLAFELVFSPGETFQLIVDDTPISRSGAQPQLGIRAVSPTAVLGRPRASRISRVWDAAVGARDAAEEVTGETIDWQILDWSIPANRLAATEVTPIEVVQQIVAAAGGVLETKPNGTLIARPKFPVTLPELSTAAQDHTFTDTSHQLSMSGGLTRPDVVNKVTVRDENAPAFSATIEAIQEAPERVRLRVYPTPFREVALRHTSSGVILLAYLGLFVRRETEVVEVYKGEGSTRYPVHAIESFTWLYNDLGGLTFTPGRTAVVSTSGSADNSMARITYTTKSHDWRATHYVTEPVQFIVDEVAS